MHDPHESRTARDPGMDIPIHILLVEDNPGDARLVSEMLADARAGTFVLVHIDSFTEALKRLTQQHFDIVLLDLILPDSRGLETLTRMQMAAPYIPIVVMSRMHDEALALQAVQHRAQDYLIKGQVDTQLLVRSLRYAIERKRAEERMQHMVTHDALTNLPNRMLFIDRLAQALIHAPRHDRMVAILLMNLDRFKRVNDTLGHPVGDLLLIAMADRLSEILRKGDTVSRLVGDEFALILDDIADADDVSGIAQKVSDSFAIPFEVVGHTLNVTASIGVSVFPEDCDNPATLLKNADLAMCRAKELGSGGYQRYSSAMNDNASHHLRLENKLCHALDRDEMFLRYQPQIDLITGKIVAVEALLRWQNPDLGLVSPAEFITVAEETGLITRIGEWVLRAACQQNKAWQTAGYPPIRMAVNLSARQFRQRQLIGTIHQVLSETGLDPSYLELELTESVMHGGETAAILQKLKDAGIHIAIDDFGMGYSSLSYLKRFPVTKLKIDQSFVQGIPDDADDMAITTAIVAMAHSLKLQVIAEGVETMKQQDFLRSLECHEMQGYYFNKPLPPSEINDCFSHNYHDRRLAAVH